MFFVANSFSAFHSQTHFWFPQKYIKLRQLQSSHLFPLSFTTHPNPPLFCPIHFPPNIIRLLRNTPLLKIKRGIRTVLTRKRIFRHTQLIPSLVMKKKLFTSKHIRGHCALYIHKDPFKDARGRKSHSQHSTNDDSAIHKSSMHDDEEELRLGFATKSSKNNNNNNNKSALPRTVFEKSVCRPFFRSSHNGE